MASTEEINRIDRSRGRRDLQPDVSHGESGTRVSLTLTVDEWRDIRDLLLLRSISPGRVSLRMSDTASRALSVEISRTLRATTGNPMD